MSNKLSNPAQESLGDGQENYYVYALVDPRSQKIFLHWQRKRESSL